jgi:hypothetical protein
MLVVYVMLSIYRPRAEVLFKCLEKKKDILLLFPHILGSPSPYMTLQLLHSEFPYI